MPTGYTHIIDDKDASFEEYIWECARGMGFAMRWRDSSGPLPREAVPEKYYTEALAKARSQLAELQAMGDEALSVVMLEERTQSLARDTAAKRENEENLRRYAAMRKRVREWDAPEKIAGLKKFALEQLDTGGPHPYDYGMSKYAAKMPTVQEYREERTEKLLKDIKFYREFYDKELVQVAETNAYMDLIRESVPQP